MSTVTVTPDSHTMPIGTAIKNLAKIYDLPPFERVYQSGRTAIVAVSHEHAEAWRAALAAPPFAEDTARVMFFGAMVQLVRHG